MLEQAGKPTDKIKITAVVCRPYFGFMDSLPVVREFTVDENKKNYDLVVVT
jgi:hypothetical protein